MFGRERKVDREVLEKGTTGWRRPWVGPPGMRSNERDNRGVSLRSIIYWGR